MPSASSLRKWSGIRESNPRLDLGKVAYYHYTNPAYAKLRARLLFIAWRSERDKSLATCTLTYTGPADSVRPGQPFAGDSSFPSLSHASFLPKVESFIRSEERRV